QPECTYPRRRLLGRRGRSVIKDQMEYANPFAPEAGEQQPQELLKFAEALALKTPRQWFTPVHQEGRGEVQPSATLVAIADMHRVPRTRRRCPAAGLPRLDRRLLIRADDNWRLTSQSVGAFV